MNKGKRKRTSKLLKKMMPAKYEKRVQENKLQDMIEKQKQENKLRDMITKRNKLRKLGKSTKYLDTYIQQMKVEQTDMRKLISRGGKNKKIRKHKGINQQTGKLKSGFKYSGKKLKSGLKQIIKT